MISCPKCSFQQPEDKFCAKCGVDMESYRPKTSYSKYIKSYLPLVFVIIGIALVATLFKQVERQMAGTPLQTEVETTSTQIGVRATSLAGAPTNSSPEPAAPPPVPIEVSPKATAPATNIIDEPTFDHVRVDYFLTEISISEIENYDPSKNSFLDDQFVNINSFYTDQLILNKSPNVIADTTTNPTELLRFNLRATVENITSNDVKVKISLQRQMAIPNSAIPTFSASVSENVPMNKYLIILDRLPRSLQNFTASSLLSTMMQSQLFLSHQTELAHILRFHDPISDTAEASP